MQTKKPWLLTPGLFVVLVSLSTHSTQVVDKYFLFFGKYTQNKKLKYVQNTIDM